MNMKYKKKKYKWPEQPNIHNVHAYDGDSEYERFVMHSSYTFSDIIQSDITNEHKYKYDLMLIYNDQIQIQSNISAPPMGRHPTGSARYLKI